MGAFVRASYCGIARRLAGGEEAGWASPAPFLLRVVERPTRCVRQAVGGDVGTDIVFFPVFALGSCEFLLVGSPHTRQTVIKLSIYYYLSIKK